MPSGRVSTVKVSHGPADARLATQLHEIDLDLEGSNTDPEHLNLRRRLTWLIDQVGNYTGKPTAAQIEWIGIFESQLNKLMADLNNILEKRAQ